jgi:hypothetical protein
MHWLPKVFRKDISPATCFLCSANITDAGADIQYSYSDNGKKALGRVLICSACANELEVTTSDLKGSDHVSKSI